jgi:hypothetical protein
MVIRLELVLLVLLHVHLRIILLLIVRFVDHLLLLKQLLRPLCVSKLLLWLGNAHVGVAAANLKPRHLRILVKGYVLLLVDPLEVKASEVATVVQWPKP